jgi:hypothetical protein
MAGWSGCNDFPGREDDFVFVDVVACEAVLGREVGYPALEGQAADADFRGVAADYG